MWKGCLYPLPLKQRFGSLPKTATRKNHYPCGSCFKRCLGQDQKKVKSKVGREIWLMGKCWSQPLRNLPDLAFKCKRQGRLA